MNQRANYLRSRAIFPAVVSLSALAFLAISARGADPSLVLYLPLDDGQGTVVRDLSIYKNNGTLVGGARWIQGQQGTALEFVGGSHVTVPEIPEHDVTSQVSLLAWVRTSTVPNWARVIDKSQWQISGFALILTQNTGYARLEFFVNNTTSLVDSRTRVNDNRWHFIAGTFGNKTLKIYVDGVMEGQSTSVNNVDINPNNWPIMVGAESSSNGGQQYFGAIDEVVMFNRELSEAEILKIFQYGMAAPESAGRPSPGHGATDVARDTTLSWTAGRYAVRHDVYLGTSLEDVTQATRNEPLGVLVSKGQTDTNYSPTVPLAYGQRYYWRVDEVNAGPDPFIYKGDVWTFVVEPYSYPVVPAGATASSVYRTTTGPEKTIGGRATGLGPNDQHTTDILHLWISKRGQTPIWIQYQFDKVYKLDQLLVWNCNHPNEDVLGWGAKDVEILCSLDGQEWTSLGMFEFAQAPGRPDYAGDIQIDLGRINAQFVKLDIKSTWGGGTQASISEVRFYAVPLEAFYPEPADGATNVPVDGRLNWRPGREATSHNLYIGTDPDQVASAQTPNLTLTDHTVRLLDLGCELDRTYYWRVDEVNGPQVWKGQAPWAFSTVQFVVVDDFESYNDRCNRIFFNWIDGLGHSGSAMCGIPPATGNGTGSTVGNLTPPFAELTIVHWGHQAMPLLYDNTAGLAVSEATRRFDPPQDWTVGGIKALSLFFRGEPTNGLGQLYLKVNDRQINYDGDRQAIARAIWKQWNVALDGPGADLKAVRQLTIGVAGPVKGKLYLDDIRLYREAPPVPVPVDPGTFGLEAYYPFEGDVKDASGKGLHGTANGGPTYSVSEIGTGQAIVLDGANDYVELPIGTLISTLSSATFTCWVNFSGQGGNWQRIFDFGTGNTNYIMLSPHQTTTGPMTCDIRVTTATKIVPQIRFAAPRTLPTGWHHVAVVVDGTDMVVKVYLDGMIVAQGTTTALPKDLGVTTQNWLGRSQFTADAFFSGMLDEFRIYSRALSDSEVLYLAGDR